MITGHGSPSHPLALQARDGGRLTDGMGTGGHNASLNGQNYAVVQAAAGQMAQVDLRALWLSQPNNLRVTVDGGPETVLQGTELPPPQGGGRRFRSKAGGNILVLLVTTENSASLSFFSLAVTEVCRTAEDCSMHGTCDTKTAGTVDASATTGPGRSVRLWLRLPTSPARSSSR